MGHSGTWGLLGWRGSAGWGAWAVLLSFAACSGERQPEPEPVIIRDTVRVLDEGERASLASYDPATGQLVFSSSTPRLAALKPGDILATEPTPAAPYGFLRKVSSTSALGGGLAVQTTQGTLREAIIQGSLAGQGTLTPADLASQQLAPGVTASPLAIGFNVPVDVLLYDVDGNFSTTGDQVRLKGNVGFDLGYGVEMGWKADYDFPFDVNISTRFVAVLYFNQHNSLALEVTGPMTGYYKEVDLGTWTFSPITFFVGPIPVVLVPRITVTANAIGTVGVNVSFGVDETLGIEAGVSKDYGHGFNPVFSVTPQGTAQGPVLSPQFGDPSFSVQGGVSARGSLRLYGLVGPFAELHTNAYLSGGIGQNPTWRVRGGIGGSVGVEADLFFWDYDWSQDIFSQYWDLAQASGNTAPIVASVTPKTGTKVQLGQPVDLHAVAGDVEDGWFCCSRSWVSTMDGAIGTEGPYGMKYTFATPGVRTLTVTATDSAGAKATAAVAVEVLNTPPVVSLAKPTPNYTWYRGYQTSLYGWATDGNQSCSTLTLVWSSSLGDAMPAASCTDPVAVTFATNGTRTLSLKATDSQGASDTKSVVLNIVDPPGNIPPDVTILEPKDGASFTDEQSVTLKALIYDPDNPTLTYNLSVSNVVPVKVIASGTVPGDASAVPGTTLTTTFPAWGNLVCSGVSVLELRVADGAGGHIVPASVQVTCTIIPK